MDRAMPGEELLMWAVGTFLAVWFVWVAGKVFFWKRRFRLTNSSVWPVMDIIRWAVRDPEVRHRGLLTLATLAALQFVFLIPLPALSAEALRIHFNRISQLTNEFQFLRIPALLNGPMGNFTIFGMGLAPFISSCLFIQLGSAFIPRLRRFSFGEESGRRKIQRLTYILTVCLALIQSFFISMWLENPMHLDGVWAISIPIGVFRLLTTVTMTAGTLLLLAICNGINKYGLGNGFALIVAVWVASGLYAAFHDLLTLHGLGELDIPILILFGLIFSAFAYAAFYMTSRERRLQLYDENSARRVWVPLRFSWTAMQPVGWAASLLIFPKTLANFTGSRMASDFASEILRLGWPRFLLSAVLVFGSAYLYTWIVFKPKCIIGLAARYGLRCSEDTERAIKGERVKLILIASLFFLVVLYLPDFTSPHLRIPHSASQVFGVFGVAVLIGVFFDLLKQLEFFRKKAESGVKDWAVCYTAIDEIEANIKSSYLEASGIPSLVEPLRFTWGMPIRTAVDQYRIHTPSGQATEARRLLLQNADEERHA